jgi:uncharacterized membrane protein HdeD (DUF308 family)
LHPDTIILYNFFNKGEGFMTTATMTTKQRPWGLTLTLGIFVLILGAVMLWAPAKTQTNTWLFLVTFLGFYWVFQGVVELVSMFQDHSMWGWKLFMGIVSIVAGGTILMYPVASAVALPKIFVLVLGIWGLMEGFMLLFMAFKGGGWSAGILGVLGIIFGGILIANYSAPGMGLTMVWTAAVFAVIGGIALIVQAFRQRSA